MKISEAEAVFTVAYFQDKSFLPFTFILTALEVIKEERTEYKNVFLKGGKQTKF